MRMYIRCIRCKNAAMLGCAQIEPNINRIYFYTNGTNAHTENRLQTK